jgi:vacuolar-type H+-ATPase subunit E/Vma4
MSLPGILAALDAESESEIKRIAERAAITIARIKADAENEAQAIRERHYQAIQLPLQAERTRRLNRARIEQVRAKSRAREALFTNALHGARLRLEQLRAEPHYADMLRALVAESLAQLNGDAIVHADPRDEPLLRAMYPQARFEFDLQTWGGVVAHTLDGRIVVVNTLEARLEQVQATLRQEVMPMFEF